MWGLGQSWAPGTRPQVTTLSELRCLLICKRGQPHLPCGAENNKSTKEKCLAHCLACSVYPVNPTTILPASRYGEKGLALYEGLMKMARARWKGWGVAWS